MIMDNSVKITPGKCYFSSYNINFNSIVQKNSLDGHGSFLIISMIKLINLKSTYSYVVSMLLPSCKIFVDSFEITWCFHYHHCLSSELLFVFVTSFLKKIVEIMYPVLQIKY